MRRYSLRKKEKKVIATGKIFTIISKEKPVAVRLYYDDGTFKDLPFRQPLPKRPKE